MLRVARPNTYKAHMSPVDSEFFDFNAVEDEAAAALLARHLLNLLERARRTKLRAMAASKSDSNSNNNNSNNNNNNYRSARRNSLAPCRIQIPQKSGTPSQWIHKLLPGSDCVHVYLPEDFVCRVVRDALRMTEGEVRGIRGCTMCVELWDGGKRMVLGKIVCDPKVVSSYLLYVRLVKATPPVDASNFRLFNTSIYEPIYISPGYQLEKKRIK